MSADDIIDPEVRRQKALDELHQYQERKRREREAKERSERRAEDEIAEAIHARRAYEAQRADTQRQMARLLADREAAYEAQQARDAALGMAFHTNMRTAAPPARRVAKLLRQHLGDKFDVLIGEISGVDWSSLKEEIKRIPIDEAGEVKHAAEQALADRLAEEALTLPTPEDDAEAEILARHGFPIEKRQAELNAGVLWHAQEAQDGR